MMRRGMMWTSKKRSCMFDPVGWMGLVVIGWMEWEQVFVHWWPAGGGAAEVFSVLGD